VCQAELVFFQKRASDVKMNDEAKNLDAAYSLKTPEDSVRHYRTWADDYDQTFVREMDYQIPFRVAEAFVNGGGTGPLLDVGAGTGLVAQRLTELGAGPVDGTDISPDMLDVARKKNLYRRLFTGDITQRLEVENDTYDGIISAGTFTLGHVGPEAFDELVRIARPGALFAITINNAHYEAEGFAAKLEELSAKITVPDLRTVRFYGPRATGDHADDTGKIALFRKR